MLNSVAAVGALFVAAFAAWVSLQDHTVNAAQISQAKELALDDRYSAALKQLSSTGSVTLREGGVLTLADIAQESSLLRPRVSKILCSHIKGRTGRSPGRIIRTSPEADIQRAITALGHPPLTPDADRVDSGGGTPPQIDLRGTTLAGADLSFTHFDGANFEYAVLASADLRRASLRKADFSGADLSKANLQVAILTGTKFLGATLAGADLTGSPMRGAQLGGADLTDALLSGNVLVNAGLVRSKLVRADLEGAQLTAASMTRADLRDANLTGARLIGTDLSGADLGGATLNQAVLDAADLTGAKGLTLAQLRSARTITAGTKLPSGFVWSPAGGVRQS